ncbi:hypothetical protein [Streptomyces sp. NPDC059371]|uniref:hypothetical protein n=1 Tax=Streptomyces sp. NPDC059371 TaxID=3346812 RepID=UPI0036A2B304
MGAMFFAVLAVAGQIEHNRETTLEGQVTAAKKGNHGGRPKVRRSGEREPLRLPPRYCAFA